jgi:hypothetical protein
MTPTSQPRPRTLLQPSRCAAPLGDGFHKVRGRGWGHHPGCKPVRPGATLPSPRPKRPQPYNRKHLAREGLARLPRT